MRIPRFRLAGAALLYAALAIAMSPAGAQSYPVKPIRILLPFAGGTDIVGRLLALKLSAALGQQVVPDQRMRLAGKLSSI